MGQNSRLTSECNCVKWFLIFLQFFLLVFGVVIIVLGVYSERAVNKASEYEPQVQRMFDSAKSLGAEKIFLYTGYLCIAIGGTIVSLALIGLLGTCCQNRGFLCCLSCLMALVMILVLAFGGFVLAVNYVDSVKEMILPNIQNYSWTDAKSKEVRPLIDQWTDFVQFGVGCCGRNSYKDWDTQRPAHKSNEYPLSCCHNDNRSSIICKAGDEDLDERGCEKPISNYLNFVGLGLCAIAGLEFLIMVLSYCLMCGIGSALRRYDSEPAVFYNTDHFGGPDAGEAVFIKNKTQRTRF